MDGRVGKESGVVAHIECRVAEVDVIVAGHSLQHTVASQGGAQREWRQRFLQCVDVQRALLNEAHGDVRGARQAREKRVDAAGGVKVDVGVLVYERGCDGAVAGGGGERGAVGHKAVVAETPTDVSQFNVHHAGLAGHVHVATQAHQALAVTTVLGEAHHLHVDGIDASGGVDDVAVAIDAAIEVDVHIAVIV